MSAEKTEIHGKCDERFISLKTQFEANFVVGKELGASICVNLKGENVVDMWAGHANADRTKPWTESSITTIWSSSKTVTSLAVLMLIDRGVLDPDERVAKYWPEFGANGKENVLVKHLISHSTGLSGWQEKLTLHDVLDLEKSVKLLEQQAPWWEPGTQSGYHSMTMGHLISPLIKRITGKSLSEFVHDELATPLGADFQYGAKESDWDRCAETILPPPLADGMPVPAGLMNPESIMFKTFMNPFNPGQLANSAEWRKAELGAANGHSNARGINRILSAVSLGGTVDNQKLLSQSTIDKIFETQVNGIDLVLNKFVRWGMGFGIAEPRAGDGKGFLDFLPPGRVATWGGWGGSIVVMDVDRGLTITYIMNKMSHAVSDDQVAKGEKDRFKEYIAKVYEALGVTI